MAEQRFDLAVIGAGPGGSACALAAARAGLSVALFEPQRGPIDKPCGEGLLASGVRVLEELGLADVLARGVALSSITYRVPGAPPLRVPFGQPGRAIERPLLAAALDAALEQEPRVVRFAHAAQVERLAEGFTVQAGPTRIVARTLAAADGARGHAAAWLRGPHGHGPLRFGLRARCGAREACEGVQILLGDPKLQVYLTPLAQGRVNVALLGDGPPGEGGAKAWLARARLDPHVARLLGETLTEPEVRALAHPRPRAVAEAGAFLVGDASGSVDPVVGCGVSIALSTGVSAARAAASLIAGRPARGVEREHAALVRSQTRARAHLASVLLSLARHPRCARAVARSLARTPRLTGFLATVAEG